LAEQKAELQMQLLCITTNLNSSSFSQVKENKPDLSIDDEGIIDKLRELWMAEQIESRIRLRLDQAEKV